jgi:hypothetical protein
MYIIGCYTVITHPKISDDVVSEDQYSNESITYYDECSQCHHNLDRIRPFEENYHTVLNNDYNNYDWRYYYTLPWWEEDRYYSLVNVDQNGNTLPPTHKRTVGRKNTSVPTASAPAPSRPGSLSKSVSPNNEVTTITEKKTKDNNKRTATRRSTGSNLKKKKKSSESDRK